MRQILGTVVRTLTPNFNQSGGNTVPGAPTVGTATAIGGGASVAFTAPASTGGSAILYYTVKSSPGGIKATGTTSPITIMTGSGGTYSFTVTATNAIGEGAPSSASNSIGLLTGSLAQTLASATLSSAGALAIAGTLAATLDSTTLAATGIRPATVPDAPVIGAATAGVAAADVTFTAPAFDGGSAITGYTATSSPGGITGTGSTSPITVAGLTNGTSYTFTVTATNAVGTSAASAASNAAVPAATPFFVPGAPTIGTATRTASQTCSVTFTAPASDGGAAITSYVATSTPGGITSSAASSPISVPGLTNGTSYTFVVHAVNSVGAGPTSAASNAAIPADVPTVPGVPFVTTETATTATIYVGYPASNGGSAYTHFRFTRSPGGVTQQETFATVNAGPITFTGLTEGVTYSFTAIAINAYGDSPTSAASNTVTPGTTSEVGKYDSLYTPGWMPLTGVTVHTPNALAQPAKSTGITNVSYTDADYGTKIFRAAQLSDSPNNGTTKMRHEYSRRQPFNCDGTKFCLQNSSSFYFVYNADTFTRLDGGVTTADVKLGAVGTNTTHMKDPRDWAWHPTDPDILYFFPQNDGLIMYEFNVVSKVLSQKFSLVGRLGMFGSPDRVRSHEGRPSDDIRYWGWQVLQGTTVLGYMTYDMQDNVITGTLVTGNASNNVTMSPSGGHIIISTGGAGLSITQCAASATIRGTRAYTRDFSSFKQVHYTAQHAAVGIDYLGQEVYISLSDNGPLWPETADSDVFMVPISGAGGPTKLINVVDATSQWNSHYSGCNTSGRPGWMVLSAWDDATVRGSRKWGDDNIMLIELKPNPTIYRLADHRTTRFSYWMEPHATISRDGLSIMY